MVRFIDTNVFIYAFLKPKRELKKHEIMLKKAAKEIINRVNKGEVVVTSIVHISEIANILEDLIPLNKALEIEEAILSKENIKIATVNEKDYISSIEIAKTYEIGLNDALAYLIMKKHKINEIYSFDTDFDKLPNIKRITK